MKEYIEREATLAALGDEPEVWCENDPSEIQERNDWHYYRDTIEAVPKADVMPVRHGCWLKCSNGTPYCSVCGANERDTYKAVTRERKYCYSCGALMDGEENDHN